MSDIPLIDYASLDEHTRQRLAAVIATHTSLERALNWGRTQRPPLAVEAILTQDEYTHDVLIPFENRYLVYDTTWLGAVTAVAVWSRKPTDRELLDARLGRGWKPTPSGLKGGDRVLGYAACIFDDPGAPHHTHEHPTPGA